jgi:hypothetical protein
MCVYVFLTHDLEGPAFLVFPVAKKGVKRGQDNSPAATRGGDKLHKHS